MAHENEGMLHPERITGQSHPLHQQVRVSLQQHAILIGARLHLVAVADQIARTRQVARHERPFLPGRKTGAAAAPQAGIDHVLLDFSGCHVPERLRKRLKTAG